MTLRHEADGYLTEDEWVEDPLVEVREYLRFRLAHWETVREHQRKWPRCSGTKSGNE